MGPIGSTVAGIGVLALIIGIILLLLGITSRGSMDTEYGRFSGPIWFILMAFGIVLMVIGAMSPI